jgi:hypothetical protein
LDTTEVNGEAMTTWGMDNEKMGLSYDQVVLMVIMKAGEVVKERMKVVPDELGSAGEEKLKRVEIELFYFFMFAIDYWWQHRFGYTREQKSKFAKIFSTHLNILFGDRAGGRAMWDDLQERFMTYGEIANAQITDSVRLWQFGAKVSEYCGIESGELILFAPELFKSARVLVSRFEAEE